MLVKEYLKHKLLFTYDHYFKLVKCNRRVVGDVNWIAVVGFMTLHFKFPLDIVVYHRLWVDCVGKITVN